MTGKENSRHPIHHRDDHPELHLHRSEPGDPKYSSSIPSTPTANLGGGIVDPKELDKATFLKLYQLKFGREEFHEASSIPFATSPALLGSHRK